jgi:hypothetical protein
MHVLVCGGRDYDDVVAVFHVLDQLHELHHINCIIEGGARGADRIAKDWARKNRIENLTYYADWTRYGKSAGAIRNQKMLVEGRPEVVVAFPGGRGTADMVSRARGASLPVWEPMLTTLQDVTL